MRRTDIEDIYPLSPLQQGMLFHELAEPDAGLYVLHRGYELAGPLSAEILQAAWERAMARHAPLRTSIQWKTVETPVQVVHRSVSLPIVVEDWRGASAEEVSERSLALDEHQQRPFALDDAPLMRLALIRLDEERHYLAWTFHHILMEGWSAAIVFDEVLEDYRAEVQNRDAELVPRRPFRDYLTWMARQDTDAAGVFWSDALHGFMAPTTLLEPAQSGDADDQGSWIHGGVETALSEEATAALQGFARANRVTLNTIVQCAWALLLGHYTNRNDVLFGTTVSGRSGDLDDIENIVGLFINTIPARIRIDPDLPLSTWLERVQAEQARSRAFEWCSLVDIHGWSEVPRSVPLFESIVVFSNWLGNDASHWEGDLSVRATRAAEGGTGYPLTLMVAPGPILGLSLAFDGRTLDPDTADRVLSHLRALLENIASAPDTPLGSLSMLSAGEREKILARNDTEADSPLDRTTYRLFEERVDEGPDRAAATCGSVALTYAELDSRANRLAHLLLEHNVSEGDVIAVCIERSLDMLVALLAVMKSGGAYLPIDPSLPEGRIAFMLDDASVRIVLTESRVADALPLVDGVKFIEVDSREAEIAGLPASRPAVDSGTDSLAYVIYTSGSTGRPKGVAVEHSSLANFLRSMQVRPGFASKDSMLAITTVSFDISGLELFLPLVSGGEVVIADSEVVADGRSLADEMLLRGVTVMQATPATWRMLLDTDWSGMDGLKALCGGEPLASELADRLVARCATLWNMYGPTETTIWSTVAQVERSGGVVSIGSPIANTQVYVLDDRGGLVPDMVRGQLYIGGAGVARGYLNRPELTAERFVADAFCDLPGARLYCTGDVARWRSDGTLECLGRTDHQMKIRGFRIEPGEIESELLEIASIGEAVVVARSFGPSDVRLVAYIVADDGTELMPSELRATLRKRLPEYMVPNIFSFLDGMPLNSSGKVDRNALPDPAAFHTRASPGRLPETDTEKAVAAAWQEVLGVHPVRAEDNFFDLGGHSLLAMQVTVRMERRFGRRVNPMKLAFLNLSQFAVECDPSSEGQHV